MIVIFFTLLPKEKEEIIIPPPPTLGGRLRSWTKAGKKGNSRGTSICPRTDASIGEMPGSRQRRLHRSDKFQLSPRQREASQIETKLFPFHGKRKGRGEGGGGAKSRQRAQLHRSRDSTPLDCLFITRATSYRDLCVFFAVFSLGRRMEYRARDTCRSRNRFQQFRPETEERLV